MTTVSPEETVAAGATVEDVAVAGGYFRDYADPDDIESSVENPLADAPSLSREKLIGLLSELGWLLETRALAVLHKSGDEHQARRIMDVRFVQPIHQRAADRVMFAWAEEEGQSLASVLQRMDSEAVWWIRCQAPSALYHISEAEHRARIAFVQFWREISHGG